MTCGTKKRNIHCISGFALDLSSREWLEKASPAYLLCLPVGWTERDDPHLHQRLQCSSVSHRFHTSGLLPPKSTATIHCCQPAKSAASSAFPSIRVRCGESKKTRDETPFTQTRCAAAKGGHSAATPPNLLCRNMVSTNHTPRCVLARSLQQSGCPERLGWSAWSGGQPAKNPEKIPSCPQQVVVKPPKKVEVKCHFPPNKRAAALVVTVIFVCYYLLRIIYLFFFQGGYFIFVSSCDHGLYLIFATSQIM